MRGSQPRRWVRGKGRGGGRGRGRGRSRGGMNHGAGVRGHAPRDQRVFTQAQKVNYLRKLRDARSSSLSLDNEFILKLGGRTLENIKSIVETNEPSQSLISEILEFFSLDILRETELRESSNRIFKTLVNCKSFLRILPEYSQGISHNLQKLNVLLCVIEELMARFLSSVMNVVPLGNLSIIAKRIGDEKFSERVDILIYQRENCERTELEQKHNSVGAVGGPPNDFTEMRIIPTIDELINPAEKDTFVRKNKIKETYDNAFDFLDTHFRLTLHDFRRPLREAILCYKETGGRTYESRSKVRVYANAKLIAISTDLNQGVIYRVKFVLPGKFKIQWAKSKRLIYGSLICLTKKNLKNVLWGTVANRKDELLRGKAPKIDIKFFDADAAIQSFQSSEEYDILECTNAYFEAYRHVLGSLQKLGNRIKEGEELPFAEHLLQLHQEIGPPKYLKEYHESERRALFDQRKSGCHEMKGCFPNLEASTGSSQFRLLSPWPEDLNTSLDKSQIIALKQILCKKLAVVQGPPGTGKTYVTLKALRILLDNMPKSDPPILVVALTNHALDQLLEGIYTYEKRIVRIGGRSANETMVEKCSLYAKRGQYFRETGNWNQDKDHKCVMNDIKAQINVLLAFIDRICGEKSLLSSFDVYNYDLLPDEQLDVLEGFASPVNEDGWENVRYQRYLEPLFSWLTQFRREREFKKSAKRARSDFNRQQSVTNVSVQNPFALLDEGFNEEMSPDATNVSVQNPFTLLDEAAAGGGGGSASGQQHLRITEEEEMKYEGGEEDDDDEDDELEEDKADLKREEIEREIFLGNEQEEKRDGEEGDVTSGSGNGGFIDLSSSALKLNSQGVTIHSSISSRLIDKSYRNIYSLSEEERWNLHDIWKQKIREILFKDLVELIKQFNEEAIEKQKIDNVINNNVLKRQRVIGMTTTGAARLVDLIREISPKIIAIEEAAELTESQTLALLHKDVEHLIQVGDHRQLRPSTSDYVIAKDYKYDISMFERLMINNVSHRVLQTQRRMRPEISELIRPFYSHTSIGDHESVTKYGHVKGMEHDLYFLAHTHLERGDSDLRSKSNRYEAEMVLGLCNYLILQGYNPSEITVLAAYSGQFYLINQLFKDSPDSKRISGIKRRVVDKYQGEENEIIILSLVRSNKEDSVGFLKLSNRVCVALSRAKVGLYVFGNLDMLARKSREWRQVGDTLKKRNLIGDSLSLMCQKHPDTKTEVKEFKEFGKAPEGGCNRPCETRLKCGHTCPRSCHPSSHDNYNCTKACEKTFEDCDHKCKKRCFQECSACMQPVQKVLSPCGHSQFISCSIDVTDVLCKTPCDKFLPCGHPCRLKCGRSCQCQQVIVLKLSCGHTAFTECQNGKHTKAEEWNCQETCNEKLDCGHPCLMKCFQCNSSKTPADAAAAARGDRSHGKCISQCTRTLICSHQCGGNHPCNSPCPPCMKKCPNRCVHSKCDHKCGEPCRPCIEPCSWKCPHLKCSKLCSELCSRPVCDNPCELRLPCGHQCIGICGEPCVVKCRECHPKWRVWDDSMMCVELEKTDRTSRFIQLADCRHIVEVSAMDMWMKKENDKKVFSLKTCPAACSIPIRRSLRYANKVKTSIIDLEVMKRRIFEHWKRSQGLSDKEKKEVIQAMGAARGHWFKCPKNHLYYIGDCGGAMEEAICSECNMKIGGSSHRLRDDNKHAGEFDGSTETAWPNTLQGRDIERERQRRQLEERRRLIEQQDREYKEALAKDLQKKQQEEREEKEQKKRAQVQLAAEKLRSQIPEEPLKTDESAINVAFRLPNGHTLRRRFKVTDPLKALFFFIQYATQNQYSFVFATVYPRKMYQKPTEETLEDLGFSKRLNLKIERRGDNINLGNHRSNNTNYNARSGRSQVIPDLRAGFLGGRPKGRLRGFYFK